MDILPKKLPARWGPLGAEKQENFRKLAKTLFDDLVILKVEMDLIDLVVVVQGEIDDDTFYMLTEPRSAGTGLRYARLLKKYLAVFEFHGGLEGATPEPFGVPFIQKYLRQLMVDEVGFRTPQSLLYVVEHFAGVFGFESPGSKHPKIKKLAADYAAKAPERSPAPHFEVDWRALFLTKKRICRPVWLAESSGCVSRLVYATAISRVQLWRTFNGAGQWVLGLRARAAKTKSGPWPWAAAWVGVNPSNDSWLFVWVDLLIKMHGPRWKEHRFVGCASDAHVGFRFPPRLITEDNLVVRKCMSDDWGAGIKTPLDEGGIRSWDGIHAKHPRTVRHQGAWKKPSQAMPDLYLREAQTLVLTVQWQVLDQVRSGATVQSLKGENLDFRPMKPDWSTASDLVLAEKVPRNTSGEAHVDAMRKAVICTRNPDSFHPQAQMQRAPVLLDLRAELRGNGEEDEDGLHEVVRQERPPRSETRNPSWAPFRFRGFGGLFTESR